jgi:hypothetical protein
VGWTAKDIEFDSRHWISASFLCAHAGSDVHLASYSLCTGRSSIGGKVTGEVMLTTQIHLVSRIKKKVELYFHAYVCIRGV